MSVIEGQHCRPDEQTIGFDEHFNCRGHQVESEKHGVKIMQSTRRKIFAKYRVSGLVSYWLVVRSCLLCGLLFGFLCGLLFGGFFRDRLLTANLDRYLVVKPHELGRTG